MSRSISVTVEVFRPDQPQEFIGKLPFSISQKFHEKVDVLAGTLNQLPEPRRKIEYVLDESMREEASKGCRFASPAEFFALLHEFPELASAFPLATICPEFEGEGDIAITVDLPEGFHEPVLDFFSIDINSWWGGHYGEPFIVLVKEQT